MSSEIEIKLRIPEKHIISSILSEPLILKWAAEGFRTKEMKASYYDTASGDLRAHRWALRGRLENGVFAVTMKTPNVSGEPGVFRRGEWEIRASALEDGISGLVSLGAPCELLDFLKKGFFKLCEISFTRYVALIRLLGGATAELSVDDGVIRAAGREERLMEMEIEIFGVDAEPFKRLADALAIKYGLAYENTSKYERALKLLD